MIFLFLLVGCAAPPTYLNRDLTPRNREEREAGLKLAADLGYPVPEDFRGYLAYVTDLRDDQGSTRRGVVLLEPALKVPGYSRVQINDAIFFGGWRHVDFTGVDKIVRPGGPDLLLIKSETMMLPQPHAYYAFAGERIELVRLEVEGKLYPNFYTSPNHTIGPVYPPADEADTLRSLQGNSWTRRMSTLTWLAGPHYTGEHPELWHEDEKAAALARELGFSAKVRAAAEALTMDIDAWTREAAELFLKR